MPDDLGHLEEKVMARLAKYRAKSELILLVFRLIHNTTDKNKDRIYDHYAIG